MKIIIFSLILPFIAKAQTFERTGNDLLLKSTDCNQVDSIISSTKDWAEKLKNFECSISEIKSEDNICRLQIKNCYPKKSEEVLGLRPKTAGPNCHNFAFVAQGVGKSIRHANYTEAVNTYNSPLCDKIGPEQAIQSGDIGRIGDSMLSSHSFIYLNNDFILSKNGDARTDFNLFQANEVYAGYGVQITEDCLKTKFRKGEKCPNGVEYYRCTSFDKYIEASGTPEQFKDFLFHFKAIEVFKDV
jgi:hypothetical protein